MKNKKKLIFERMKEIYAYYQKEMNKEVRTNYYVNDLDLERYALKILLDIYTFDEKENEDNRYLYQDWELCDFVINEILNGNLK